MDLNKMIPKAGSVIITVFLVALFIMGCSNEKDPIDDISEDPPARQYTVSKKALPSRSDFENLDKEASVEEIIEQFGECGYEGSGIISYVWHLDDGSKAKLIFNSKGKIEFIYIVTDDSSERIYDRDDPEISPETENEPETENDGSDDSEAFEEDKTLIDPDGNTLQTRILVPEGYERTHEEPASLGEFLRNYKVLPDKSPVLLFDGTVKSNDHAACVFDMYLSGNDLQQCADSVMRVYAEYMRSSGKEDKIAFHFVNGFLCDWNSFKNGKRILVSGNDVSWADGGAISDSDDNFEKYLETVYMYASTLSLDKESRSVELSDIQIGDIFIKGGSPGHVVMVVDVCEKEGKKAFLLAQGYMPAQQFHVLVNEYHEPDPWYYEEEITYPFITPEYVFNDQCLKRPVYLDE